MAFQKWNGKMIQQELSGKIRYVQTCTIVKVVYYVYSKVSCCYGCKENTENKIQASRVLNNLGTAEMAHW